MNFESLLSAFGLGMAELLGLGLLSLFVILMLGFAVLGRRHPWGGLRPIAAFSRLAHAVGLAVEDGSRLHLSLGHGDLTGPRSAAAFVGLSMLARIIRVTSESDSPPVTTSGNGALAILSQDTLRRAYAEMGASDQYDPHAGRMAGLTPFSFAVGTMPIIRDEAVSANVLAGSFGSEVALITEAGDRVEGFTLAGTDSIPGQAVLYATAEGPLIGEELYAGGAYLNAGGLHTASLHAQDVVRWLLVVLIVGGGLYNLLKGF